MTRAGGRSARVWMATIVAGATLLAVPALGAQPAWALNSKNLVKNGTAEKGVGGTGGTVVVPNWTDTEGTTFTAVTYAAGDGFPESTSPGPKNRGLNFFAGGQSDPSDTIIAEQTDSLKNYATAIAGGGVTFTLQGYFGGFSVQTDQAQAKITFFDKHHSDIGDGLTAPVTEVDRGGVTGLLKRTATGAVPAGAKTVLVQLVFVRNGGGYNDGYADNISLVLSGV